VLASYGVAVRGNELSRCLGGSGRYLELKELGRSSMGSFSFHVGPTRVSNEDTCEELSEYARLLASKKLEEDFRESDLPRPR
jgi:hypothetical protein